MVTWIYNRLDRVTITSQWDLKIQYVLLSILPFEKMSITSDLWFYSLLDFNNWAKTSVANQNVKFMEVVKMFT